MKVTEVRVVWKRTWQTKPYESEGAELAITLQVDPADKLTKEGAGELASAVYRQLADEGTEVMRERLALKP